MSIHNGIVTRTNDGAISIIGEVDGERTRLLSVDFMDSDSSIKKNARWNTDAPNTRAFAEELVRRWNSLEK